MFLEKVLLRSIKNNNPSLVTLALLARITNASANSCTECTFGESVLSPSPTERKLCIYAKRRKIKARVFFPLFFLFCLFFPFFHFFCNAYYVARVIYVQYTRIFERLLERARGSVGSFNCSTKEKCVRFKCPAYFCALNNNNIMCVFSLCYFTLSFKNIHTYYLIAYPYTSVAIFALYTSIFWVILTFNLIKFSLKTWVN